MKISVFGMGKLGLPLALLLADAGHEVVGVDVSEEVVEKINNGISPINETGVQEFMHEVSLHATTDGSKAAIETDVSFVVVPTPSVDGVFTNQYVLEAVGIIGGAIWNKDTAHTVIITSTVMPQSCDNEIIPFLEECSGRKVGDRLNVCYSPEFIALGSVIQDMLKPDMVLIGESSPEAGEILHVITEGYVAFGTPFHRMSIVNAEIAKISLNTYVTMKISYANTLAEICEKIPGADANVVTKAIGTDRRIGVAGLKPGTAYGGPCFPRDTIAFSQMSFGLHVPAELAEATDHVNSRQVRRLTDIVMEEYGNKDIVAVLGLAYKPNTDVYERAVGPNLVRNLRAKGATVMAHDPVARPPEMDIATYADILEYATILVVTTPWKEYGMWCFDDKRVIDCWNCVHPLNKNVRRIGVGSVDL